MSKKIAIHAITLNGSSKAEQLAKLLPNADLFISEKFSDKFPEAKVLTLPLTSHFKNIYSSYQQHVCFFSVGITTRILAPLLADKRTDPGVTCIDEQATFCIPVLSGHRGGANAMALQVAQLLKATPVLTTASDASKTLSVDLLGEPYEWCIDAETESAITPVSAAIVNGDPVVIIQETGERNWWPYKHEIPAHIHIKNNLNEADIAQYKAAILISDRTDILDQLINLAPHLKAKCVVWRPNSLVIGIGCDRNTPLHTLNLGLTQFMSEQQLAYSSISALASISLKADEIGLQLLAKKMNKPFVTYSADTLNEIEGIENPSETVKRCVGVSSVAEAAALHHAAKNKLLAPKWKYHHDGKNMTLALCRKTYNAETKELTSCDDIPATNSCAKNNVMGSSVEPGFNCKPKVLDPERPLLYYRYHLLICSGGRCAAEGGKQLANNVRDLLKDMGLNRGKNRIKVNRSFCLGACRNRVTAVIYNNLMPNEVVENHTLWLRRVDQLSTIQWKQLFTALIADEDVRTKLPTKYFAAINLAP